MWGKRVKARSARNLRARRETVQGAAGQGGDDVRVADGEGEVGGKLKVEILSDMGAEITALEAKLSKVWDRSCREDGSSRQG